MRDDEIVALYFARDERAIRESGRAYGAMCRRVAYNVLGSREDSEEAENDAYLAAWNAIPPARPISLGAYLAQLCRRIAIDALRRKSRLKRGGGEWSRTLEELEDCIPAPDGDPADALALRQTLEDFLSGLDPETRRIFLLRYWWAYPVRAVAERTGLGVSAVKMRLSRARAALGELLRERGLV